MLVTSTFSAVETWGLVHETSSTIPVDNTKIFETCALKANILFDSDNLPGVSLNVCPGSLGKWKRKKKKAIHDHSTP